MREQLYTLLPLHSDLGTVAPGFTLLEAFTRLMAVAERDYMFFRAGAWIMHLAVLPPIVGEPPFESCLSVDAQARAEIMRKACDHGLGVFRVVRFEDVHCKGADHDRAA